jgi:hypothetical protein
MNCQELGHNFRARYKYKMILPNKMVEQALSIGKQPVLEFLDTCIKRIYVFDICSRCGIKNLDLKHKKNQAAKIKKKRAIKVI